MTQNAYTISEKIMYYLIDPTKYIQNWVVRANKGYLIIKRKTENISVYIFSIWCSPNFQSAKVKCNHSGRNISGMT